MTPTEQNIAIAKALGYTVTLSDLQSGIDIHKPGEYRRPLPDYTTDLNAIHAAVKQFDNDSYKFDENLQLVVMNVNRAFPMSWQDRQEIIDRRDGCFSIVDTHYAIHATAAQRAEALLRTLNLWTD